jgi:thiol-disulfide isomerase/thioredoxin
MRISIIIVLVASSIGVCRAQTMAVPLTRVFKQGSLPIEQVLLMDNPDKIKFHGVPDKFSQYSIKYFNFQKDQFLFEKFLRKEISPDSFHHLISLLNIDTSALSRKPVRQQFNVLINYIDDTTRLLVPDLNCNYDFSDDKQVVLRKGTKEMIQFAPEIFTNGELHKSEISFYLDGFNSNYTLNDSLANRLKLVMSNNVCLNSHITLNGKRYSIEVINGYSLPRYDSDHCNLMISEANVDTIKKVDFVNSIFYRPSEEIIFSDRILRFDGLSQLCDTLFLTQLGENPNRIGFLRGFHAPALLGLNLSMTATQNVRQDGRFLLLDFLGSWCGPCIAMLPEIKQFEKKHHSKVQVVSVAYEYGDSKKLMKIVRDSLITWPVIVNDNKDIKNSIVNKLKVFSYPTYILISSDGVVLFRGVGSSDFQKLESFLN